MRLFYVPFGSAPGAGGYRLQKSVNIFSRRVATAELYFALRWQCQFFYVASELSAGFRVVFLGADARFLSLLFV